MTAPVTLAEMRAFLNLASTDTTQDSELTAFMNAATEQVESAVGPMVSVSVTTVVYGHNGQVVLPTPLISVQSLAFDGGTPFDLTNLNIDLEAGVINSRYGYALATWWWETPNVNARPFQVTYTAGRSPVPESLKQATMLVAEQLWKSQRGGRANRLGGSDEQVYMGFLWPSKAVALCEPYRQFAFA